MAAADIYTEAELRLLLARGEGQFVEFKSLWDRSGANPRVLDRATARSFVAETLAAFANSDGGTLVLGVDDDGSPSGHGYPPDVVEDIATAPERRLSPPLRPRIQRAILDGADLIIMDIAPSPEAVMVEGNGFPYRIGESVVRESQDAINDRKIAYRRRGYEQRINLEATFDDLDMDLAGRFLQRVAEAGRPVTEVMQRYGLIHFGGPSGVRITNAALMLFSREPLVRWHPRADARLFRVDGTVRQHGRHRNVQQVAHLDLPVASMIGTLRDAVRAQVRRSEQLSDLFFEDTPEYPDFAWQEALVNALAHRDYDDFGRSIEVWFYDDRMEVHSPGGLVPPVTLEALRAGAPSHASRNPILVRVLAAAGIMRDEGEGVPRMFREMHGMGLPPPEFGSDNDSHIVRLRSSPERSPNRTPNDTSNRDDHGDNGWNLHREAEGQESRIAQLRVRMIALGKILDDKGAVTNTDYRDLFGADRRRALADLSTLVDLGWLVKQGERRGTRYVKPG